MSQTMDALPKMLDSYDPGLAARVNFAAMWLFAETSMMNAQNMQRQQQGCAMAYDDTGYALAMEKAAVLAQTGELPAWVLPGREQQP